MTSFASSLRRATFITLVGLGSSVGCSTSAVVADAGPGAAPDGSSATDASVPDTGATLPDASGPDAADADAGFTCGPFGGRYTDAQKSCAQASDCAMLRVLCYCGFVPIIGISKANLAEAERCEDRAQLSCGSCPRSLNWVAEDGRNNVDGGTIEVRCDLGKCHTVIP